jgi:hypothetical protein
LKQKRNEREREIQQDEGERALNRTLPLLRFARIDGRKLEQDGVRQSHNRKARQEEAERESKKTQKTQQR